MKNVVCVKREEICGKRRKFHEMYREEALKYSHDYYRAYREKIVES